MPMSLKERAEMMAKKRSQAGGSSPARRTSPSRSTSPARAKTSPSRTKSSAREARAAQIQALRDKRSTSASRSGDASANALSGVDGSSGLRSDSRTEPARAASTLSNSSAAISSTVASSHSGATGASTAERIAALRDARSTASRPPASLSPPSPPDAATSGGAAPPKPVTTTVAAQLHLPSAPASQSLPGSTPRSVDTDSAPAAAAVAPPPPMPAEQESPPADIGGGDTAAAAAEEGGEKKLPTWYSPLVPPSPPKLVGGNTDRSNSTNLPMAERSTLHAHVGRSGSNNDIDHGTSNGGDGGSLMPLTEFLQGRPGRNGEGDGGGGAPLTLSPTLPLAAGSGSGESLPVAASPLTWDGQPASPPSSGIPDAAGDSEVSVATVSSAAAAMSLPLPVSEATKSPILAAAQSRRAQMQRLSSGSNSGGGGGDAPTTGDMHRPEDGSSAAAREERAERAALEHFELKAWTPREWREGAAPATNAVDDGPVESEEGGRDRGSPRSVEDFRRILANRPSVVSKLPALQIGEAPHYKPSSKAHYMAGVSVAPPPELNLSKAGVVKHVSIFAHRDYLGAGESGLLPALRPLLEATDALRPRQGAAYLAQAALDDVNAARINRSVETATQRNGGEQNGYDALGMIIRLQARYRGHLSRTGRGHLVPAPRFDGPGGRGLPEFDTIQYMNKYLKPDLLHGVLELASQREGGEKSETGQGAGPIARFAEIVITHARKKAAANSAISIEHGDN